MAHLIIVGALFAVVIVLLVVIRWGARGQGGWRSLVSAQGFVLLLVVIAGVPWRSLFNAITQ